MRLGAVSVQSAWIFCYGLSELFAASREFCGGLTVLPLPRGLLASRKNFRRLYGYFYQNSAWHLAYQLRLGGLHPHNNSK